MASATTSSFQSFPSTNRCQTHGPPRCHPHRSYVTFRQPMRCISAAFSTATVDERINRVHNMASFYEVLGVQDGATCKEIKAAYRRLARAVHPDVVAGSSDVGKPAVTTGDEFIRVNEAYVALKDPATRADYDKTLAFKRRRMVARQYKCSNYENGTPSNSRFGGAGSVRRTWESDQCW